MMLYVIEIYSTALEEWQTINIWKTRQKAENAIEQYRSNYRNAGYWEDDIPTYRIVEIDTDSEDDCIYDVVDENNEE